ncbi:MAG: cupredoxin domain-containing protein [Mycobacteriales bacterium]
MKKRATLLAVPLLLVSCSSGSRGTGSVTTSGAADAQTVRVEMRNDLKFHPSTVNGRIGRVTFDVANVESIAHNLVFDEDFLGKTGTVDGKTDEKLTVTFDKAGTFSFTCTFHPGMAGKVVIA